MRQITTKQRGFDKEWQRFLAAISSPSGVVDKTVSKILAAVRREGDRALFRYTRQFDRFAVNARNVRISEAHIQRALNQISKTDLALLKRATRRIRRFHEKQRLQDYSLSQKGIRMGLRWSPIERVGIYVPGGKAAYPSTVLMNAIPAQVAGVKQIVMVTPTPGAQINPHTIAAASVAGIDEIYRVGGAQAIAALAFGTQSIPAVNKIVGPGNIYVALAKQKVFGRVAIDMIAGPTEVLVIADGSASPDYVAADLLSQAEHDPDARPVLIATSSATLERSIASLNAQLATAERKEIARRALKRNGLAILAKNRNEAVQLANEMAPEHLVLMVKDPKSWMAQVENAGAIFLGSYSPVAAGDYLAGPNHVLPTARTARYASPLGVYDFMKASSWLELSRKGLEQLGADIVQLSDLEGLTAHGDSVTIRLNNSPL